MPLVPGGLVPGGFELLDCSFEFLSVKTSFPSCDLDEFADGFAHTVIIHHPTIKVVPMVMYPIPAPGGGGGDPSGET